MPPRLIGAINTAEELRELKELGLLPGLDKISAFEFECFRIAEGAARTVEAEYYKEISSKSDGKNSGPDKFGGAGDEPDSHSAFGSW